MTGNVGDVVLMHPLMVHSASRNSLRIPRIIANPPVALKETFEFDLRETGGLQSGRADDASSAGERAPGGLEDHCSEGEDCA
jgi:hypothetical protein